MKNKGFLISEDGGERFRISGQLTRGADRAAAELAEALHELLAAGSWYRM